MYKGQRKQSQKYHQEEFRIPFVIYKKGERISQTGYGYKLNKVAKGLGLVYAPSAKDRDILGGRLTSTSFTLIMPQQNGLLISSDMLIKIDEPRLISDGFFDVVEVLPDIQNGRYMKLLVNRTKQGNKFEVVEDE